MLHSRYTFLLVTCLILYVFCVTDWSAAADLTEAQFKAMKIKDLRAFLDDRGLKCVGCQEKADFVRMAYQNQAKNPVNEEPRPQTLPDGKLWEVWSANAKKVCAEETVKRGNDPDTAPFSEVCSVVSTAVESFFMQHGRRISQKLKKKPDSILKTSYKPVYYDAGIIFLTKIINKCFLSPTTISKCESLNNILMMMEDKSTDMNMWLTNVGIENTNPMFDIIQSENNGDL